MRKIYLSMLLLMLCVVCAVANPVTQAQALQKAKAFLQKRGMTTATNLNLVYQGRQVAQKHGAPAKDPCYYVFNNGQNAGFVIMAGDDCADEVLGYADNGKFDPNDIPDNMEAFLKGYVEEIEAARARHSSPNNTDVAVEVTRKVVAPLIQTHWNQEDPYNQMCYNNSGQQCVTGCVATALAQVMYYHKWPQGSTNSVPAYTSEYGDSFSTLSPTTFKWDKMKPVYVNTGEDDENAELAVAELMWYCGHSVKMNYNPNESGGYESYIPEALKDYFNYPGNPQWVLRDSYTTEEWDELIYNELKYGRPVLYGANTSSGSGHEFICDGYDGHGLYHINWGWGGQSDGYFRLQALRPADQGTGGSSGYGGYSLNHDAIIGVSATEIPETPVIEEPDPTEPVYALKTNSLQVTSDLTIDYSPNSGFNSVSAKFGFSLAEGAEAGSYDVGIGLYQDGQPLQQVSIFSNQNMTNGSNYNVPAQQIFWGLGRNLDDGTYQIMCINRVSGTEDWNLNVWSEYKYVEVVIGNGQATFTNVSMTPPTPPVPTRAIAVTNVEQRFDLGENFTQIRAYVTNTGETDYSGSVNLLINNSWKGKEGIYIPVGGKDYVDIFFSAMTGTVNLVLSTDQAGTNALFTNSSFNLSAFSNPASTNITFTDANIKNIKNKKLYGSMLEGTVQCANNGSEDFEGYLKLTLYIMLDGSYASVRQQQIPVSINANTTKTVAINYTGLTVGDRFAYSLTDPANNVLAGDDFINSSYWTLHDVVPAIIIWKGNGERTAVEPSTNFTIPEDVCAVSLEDLGSNLGSYHFVLNNNPNTIVYIKGDATGFSNPLVTTVKGGIAGNVELTASYDFYIPKYFRANQIVYRWTPEIGADGKNGWQTITLPFGVQKVISAAKTDPIDWYHGNETGDDKDFWVREFKQVEGNTVKFADALEWVANVPYIIAVPGDHWGAQYDLTKKEMQFIAKDVLVERTAISAVVSDGYEFIGLTGGLNPLNGAEELAFAEKFANVYILNERGNAFVPGDALQIEGKHNVAYFTINDRTITPPACLNIGTFDTADGISTPRIAAAEGQQVDVYAIDGVKVSSVTINNGTIDLSNLPKGVYIVDGKKIVNQ